MRPRTARQSSSAAERTACVTARGDRAPPGARRRLERRAWHWAVSGIENPVPSSSLTRRRRQRLRQEHRQRHHGRIEALAVLGQMRLGDLQHAGSGRHADDLHCVSRADTLPDGVESTLCDGVRRFTKSRRRTSRIGLGACLVTNIHQPLASPHSLPFNRLAMRTADVGVDDRRVCIRVPAQLKDRRNVGTALHQSGRRTVPSP